MKSASSLIKRTAYVVVATMIIIIAASPLFRAPKAYAYNQPSSREIMMSSSTAGNTGTTYEVKFTTSAADTGAPIEGIVINFCDNDPIISDSCTYTSGHSIVTSGAVLSSITGTPDTTIGASNWQISSNSNTQTSGNGVILAITDTSSTESTNNVSASTAITITFTTITNPSYASCTGGTVPNCSFYARILTYTTNTAATSYASQTIGTPTDAGGVALSTAAQITVISKVQEELSFCVYNSTGQTTSCGTTPTINLGNNNGVLSTAGPFVDKNIDYDVQTNAGGGAAINMQGTTLETSGAVSSIAGLSPIGASSAGTSQFGICTWEESGTSGQLVPDSATNHDYSGLSGSNGALCSDSNISQSSGTATPSSSVTPWLYFNTSGSTGIPSTYGDAIATDSAGPTATGKIAFLGNIAITQAAGIYTANLSLIANGTY